MYGPFTSRGARRNYGWGRSLAYAGLSALRSAFVERYSTVHTHAQRFSEFAKFVRAEFGICDLSTVDPQSLLEKYARHLAARCDDQERAALDLKPMSVAYATNLISSAQITLRFMTDDHSIGVSPSRYVGQRSHQREKPPASINEDAVDTAIKEMASRGHHRASVVTRLVEVFGLRRREASLADLDRLMRESERQGWIQVSDGTKGGRRLLRKLDMTPDRKEALEAAIAARPPRSKNLLAETESWVQFRDRVVKLGLRILRRHQIFGYRDLRAGYACRRYRQLTGAIAPCVGQERTADRESDRYARMVIAHELGHGRTDVVASYCGGSKRRRP